MSEPLTPLPDEIDQLAWLVWYARKRRGKARDVAQAAWDENPFLRRASDVAEGIVDTFAALGRKQIHRDRVWPGQPGYHDLADCDGGYEPHVHLRASPAIVFARSDDLRAVAEADWAARPEVRSVATQDGLLYVIGPFPPPTPVPGLRMALDIVKSHVLPIGNSVDYSRGFDAAAESIERDIREALARAEDPKS